jgi:hypothetical protein
VSENDRLIIDSLIWHSIINSTCMPLITINLLTKKQVVYADF